MKILVTGGAGYIGSHFVKAAMGAGHRAECDYFLDKVSIGHRWAVLAEDFYDTDLAGAHLLALDYLMTGGRIGTFNLGGNRGHTVREDINVIVGHAWQWMRKAGERGL